MKPLHLLCAASLLVNAALAFLLFRPSNAHSTATTRKLVAPVAPQITSAPPLPTSPELAAHWTALRNNDLAQFTANLRAAGLPDPLIRRIIAAEIDDQFLAREEALRPPRKKLKYWQTDNSTLPMETQLALLDLRREKARLRAQILGPELIPTNNFDDNPIAPSKREMLKLIAEDYNTMINAVRGQGSMLLAAENDKIKYLQAEKKRELSELLSPEEMAEYEKRSSPITQRLRSQLKDFDASDAEFNAIYATEKAFQDRIDASKNSSDESWKVRTDAFQEITAQLKPQLGDSRFADYLRARDDEYQQLAQLAQRTGLPASVAASVFDLREIASKKSVEIFDSKTLSQDEKRTALETLAASTRAQIRTSLGTEAADAYFNTADRWLNTIAHGKITFSDFGRSRSSSSLNPSSRTKTLPTKQAP